MASKRKRQTEIPGTERQGADEELDEVVQNLVNARYKRMELQKAEIQAELAVQETMRAKKKRTYVYFDGEFEFDVTLTPGPPKVKLKRKKLDDVEEFASDDDQQEQESAQ